MTEENFLLYTANFSAFWMLSKLNKDDNHVAMFNLKRTFSLCQRFATIWSAPVVHTGYMLYQLAKGLFLFAWSFRDPDIFKDALRSLKAALLSLILIPSSIFLNFGDWSIEFNNRYPLF